MCYTACNHVRDMASFYTCQCLFILGLAKNEITLTFHSVCNAQNDTIKNTFIPRDLSQCRLLDVFSMPLIHVMN